VLGRPVCIHIHRAPVEVAASLQRRNKMPIEVGLLLWQRYVVSAHAAAEGLPAVRVAHRELMKEPMEVVSRVQRELEDLGVAGLRQPAPSEVAAFVNEELYRERELREDLQAFRDAPQVALHRAVANGRRLPVRLTQFGREARAALEAYEAGLPPVITPKEKRREEARRKEEALAREQALDAMLPAVGELRDAAEAQTGALQRVVTQTGALEQILHTQAGTLEQILGAQTNALEQILDAQSGALEQVTIALEAGRKQEAEHAARIEALVAENTELRDGLAARDREAATRSRDLVALREQFRSVSDAKASVDRALEDRFREIAQLTRMLDEAELGLETSRKEHAGVLQQVEALKKQVDALAKAGRERTDEVATLLAGLVARQQEVERLEARLARLRSENELFEARVRGAREIVARERSAIDAMKASRSWRVTRPLRWAVDLASRRSRGRNAGLARDRDLIRASGLFDDAWYLAVNPDVRDSGADPIEHYLVHGATEGRDPGGEFQTRFYLEAYPDVAGAGINPLVHYILHGAAEGRATKAGQGR